jgi:hypothetical protein
MTEGINCRNDKTQENLKIVMLDRPVWYDTNWKHAVQLEKIML